MAQNIRTPQQQRSIEKKNKIIKAGYKLFAKNGYFNTNTAEIAKEAGVSTGIVYGYFHDKRDILLDVLDIYINKAFKPIFKLLQEIPTPVNFEELITDSIDIALESHRKNAAIHQTLHSLTTTDQEVNDKFLVLEHNMTKLIVEKLNEAEYNCPDLVEKVHLSMETIQSFSHEYVYDNHKYIDYTAMKRDVIQMLLSLFK